MAALRSLSAPAQTSRGAWLDVRVTFLVGDEIVVVGGDTDDLVARVPTVHVSLRPAHLHEFLTGASHEVVLLLTGALTLTGRLEAVLHLIARLPDISLCYMRALGIPANVNRRFLDLADYRLPGSLSHAISPYRELSDTDTDQQLIAALLLIGLPGACRAVAVATLTRACEAGAIRPEALQALTATSIEVAAHAIRWDARGRASRGTAQHRLVVDRSAVGSDSPPLAELRTALAAVTSSGAADLLPTRSEWWLMRADRQPLGVVSVRRGPIPGGTDCSPGHLLKVGMYEGSIGALLSGRADPLVALAQGTLWITGRLQDAVDTVTVLSGIAQSRGRNGGGRSRSQCPSPPVPSILLPGAGDAVVEGNLSDAMRVGALSLASLERSFRAKRFQRSWQALCPEFAGTSALNRFLVASLELAAWHERASPNAGPV